MYQPRLGHVLQEVDALMYHHALHESVLKGLPTSTVQSWLTIAQGALQNLMIGQYSVTVSYSDKSVTYTQPQIAQLTQWIHFLQRVLNTVPPRRAIRPFFR